MNKQKLLILLVSILLILNAVLVVLFYKQNRRPRPGQRMERGLDDKRDDKLKEHFNFDERQMEGFKESKVRHGKKVRSLKDDLKMLSKEYYHLNNEGANSQKRDSLLSQIELINKGIYKSNIEHFDDIRDLCNEKQLEKLDIFIDNLLSEHQGKPSHGIRPPRPKGK